MTGTGTNSTFAAAQPLHAPASSRSESDASVDTAAVAGAPAELPEPSQQRLHVVTRQDATTEQPSTQKGPAALSPLFEGVFLGGFECSCHQLADGRRLDLSETTRHAELSGPDYARLGGVGMTACRDGVSWVRAEEHAGRFDFSFLRPMLKAADQYGVQVVWDLMHFGWPSHVDVFATSFPKLFARYVASFARWLANESSGKVMISPINEMSYLAWAGGDVGCMNPFQLARGVELKVQLVRATIEAIEAIRSVFPGARFLQPEPAINIVARPEHPKTWRRVESDNLLQFQAWDMLCGRVWPALGGHPRYLDIVGVNFYSDNQFMLDGTPVLRGDERYRPFSRMLLDVWERYRRPMIVSETGHEGDLRVPWLRYVCDECVSALDAGCELHGVTLYPVVNSLGWGDDRRCENGLWEEADESGHRPINLQLAEELKRQTPRLMAARGHRLARSNGSTFRSWT